MSLLAPVMHDLVTTPAIADAYRASGAWVDELLASRIGRWVDERPDDVAVVDQLGTRQRSYGELWDDADALAGHLLGVGVGRGDVVSTQMPNVYEAVVTAVAIHLVGAVTNPLLPNYREKELAHVFAHATPAAIVSPSSWKDTDHGALVAQAAAAAGHRPHHITFDVGTAPVIPEIAGVERRSRERPSALDVSEVIFTSGTEATPKAILHTEATVGFSCRTAYRALGLTDTDVVWMPSPVGHSTGFNYGLRFALFHGLKLVLQDRWDAAEAADLIAAHGCSYTLASTTFLQDLVDECARTDRSLPSMRCFGCGGAPVPAPLVIKADRHGIAAQRLYGSTEVLVATWNRPGMALAKRTDTDGDALPGVSIRILSPDGTPLNAGSPGEIAVQGPNTSVGYFADEERTARTYVDGWIRSGDLGVLDDDGFLTVIGRIKEIIIRGGMNISPREVEDLVLEVAPEVERCAAVGLPDDRLGERMCLFVVPKAGASSPALGDVVDRLRDRGVATYKLPERLETIDALPMTASGKVQKHVLRALVTGDG